MKRSYLQKYEKKLRRETYNTATDLPILNWWNIHEGEIDQLFKVPRKPKNNEIAILADIWEGIVCEFIDTLGISKQYIKILEAKKSLILLQIKYSKTKDKRLKLFITIAQRKLESLIGEEIEQVGNYEQKALVSKALGFAINGKTTSVIDYYSYIKILEKQAKAAENGRK